MTLRNVTIASNLLCSSPTHISSHNCRLLSTWVGKAARRAIMMWVQTCRVKPRVQRLHVFQFLYVLFRIEKIYTPYENFPLYGTSQIKQSRKTHIHVHCTCLSMCVFTSLCITSPSPLSPFLSPSVSLSLPPQGEEFLYHAIEVKNIWLPMGEIYTCICQLTMPPYYLTDCWLRYLENFATASDKVPVYWLSWILVKSKVKSLVAALRVFLINMATVRGPTPPGTGVRGPLPAAMGDG